MTLYLVGSCYGGSQGQIMTVTALPEHYGLTHQSAFLLGRNLFDTMDGSASFLIGKTLPPYLYSSKLQYSVEGRIMGTVASIWFLVSAVAVLFLVMGALRNEKKAPD